MNYNKAFICLVALVGASLSFAGNGGFAGNGSIDLNLDSTSNSSVDFGAVFSGTTSDLGQSVDSPAGTSFAGDLGGISSSSNGSGSGSNKPQFSPPTPAPEPVTVLLGVGAIATAIARRRR